MARIKRYRRRKGETDAQFNERVMAAHRRAAEQWEAAERESLADRHESFKRSRLFACYTSPNWTEHGTLSVNCAACNSRWGAFDAAAAERIALEHVASEHSEFSFVSDLSGI